ncbi:hypothetical protein ACTIVE_4809 [Actinomadura verrucosospora]|uniref:Uncharacterized protein n=1 Tax=Actinomadura verrucosospora TaxID=46165 RepID=A0A7D4AP73_ACTVE|nr:hypothetical protein ACTIVE_4809 [Actinomadura verrucosospora]
MLPYRIRQRSVQQIDDLQDITERLI